MNKRTGGALAVMDHHVELARLEFETRKNADARAICGELLQREIATRAAVAELIDAANQMLAAFDGWGTTDAPSCVRMRAALAACGSRA